MDFPQSFTGGQGQDNVSPLQGSGVDYPCMAPNYDSLASQLTVQPGESGQIILSQKNPIAAPHGGGSCQISLTYDTAPTASSRFTVIKSFMGGCPVLTAGNDAPGPYVLSYTIPEDAPKGKAILAWTWFNKIGNREMYMRCSPITIGGSSSDFSTFNTRPEIFKANIGNGCTTKANTNVIFPDPGQEVVGQGDDVPEGNCGTSSAPKPPVANPTEPSTTATPTKPSATATPTQILPPNDPVVKLPSPVKPPIVESPVETPTTPVESEVPEAPVETETPEAPVEDEEPVEDEKPIVAKPISPPAVVAPETPVAAPSTPPSKDAIPCDKPGAVVCTSDNTFALCNHGFLVDMGRTAMGTSCSQGKITARAYPIRLTGHLRRRHGKF
jgi:hypothetical protein